ncbi:cell division protein FtsN [Paenibacillus albidus]|uniref:Cell division protein FtsN n=1 Tax=Paenibacillus albidus TaxID=2041023 RepID=A0A917C044_9BACL|nr:TasA family protein [Paenibacillus albidus]GGF65309.1 cell division protein FtsN [Paenibacillus albidus]
MGIKKTLALGVASAALGLSLIGGGTYAYFSDTAESTATFAAGTLDLNTNPVEVVALNNMKPGDIAVRSFQLKNDGTLDIKQLSLVTDYTVTNAAGAAANTEDLGGHYKVKILDASYTSGSIAGHVVQEVTFKDLKALSELNLLTLPEFSGGISAGTSKNFKVAFEFVENNNDQNQFQGDGISIKWTFNAKQGIGELK